MTYPGGKNGAGIYQRLINQIPPHDVYIETHLGGGAIMLNKKPAKVNVGIEIDPVVFERWQALALKEEKTTFDIINSDAVSVLRRTTFKGRTFVYSDPPYLMATRKGGPVYKYEYSEKQHVELLETLRSLPCMVMISGYRHALYDEVLFDWRRLDYQAPTRQGLVEECCWMNYPQPVELHDYRYLGHDFRERERIRKKITRWTSNLMSMPVLERKAIVSAICSRTEAS